MRTKEFQKKIEQANKKAEQIQKEGALAYLRKLNEARELYEEAILLTLAEKVKKDSHREAKP